MTWKSLSGCFLPAAILCSTGAFAASFLPIQERFTVSDDGVITDTETDLRWIVGPDRDISWADACAWADTLEGDWRIPLRDELVILYGAGIDTDSWGPFENSGWQIWCIDIRTGAEKYLCNFLAEDAYWWLTITDFSGARVLAVKSPPERVMVGAQP